MNPPICARCRRPVEKFDEAHNAFTETVRFTAHCHGETETVSFNESELTGAIAIGEAFRSMMALGGRPDPAKCTHPAVYDMSPAICTTCGAKL